MRAFSLYIGDPSRFIEDFSFEFDLFADVFRGLGNRFASHRFHIW